MEQCSQLRSLERIVLTGFMGSGKSTVGRLVASQLHWSFADLDSSVEERCGRTVNDLFATFGEEHFRAEEAAALRPLLRQSHLVLALGGGAPETASNRELLHGHPATAIVYLEAPFATLCDRCDLQAAAEHAQTRPILADRTRANERFLLRQRLYESIATLRIDTTKLSAEAVAMAVVQHLH